MSFNIKTIPRFDKNLKKLIKKYPSLKGEFIELVQNLKSNPFLGVSIGHNCYKIRLSIAAKGKGKSGGARVITHLMVSDSIIYLLTIFDKSEKENLSDKELTNLLKMLLE